MDVCNDGRSDGGGFSDADLEQVQSNLERQEEVEEHLSKTESRLDQIAERTETTDSGAGGVCGKLVRDRSFHIYEVVDLQKCQRPQGTPGETPGEDDVRSLIKKLAAEHQEFETRLQALEARVDCLEQEYQHHRDEADAAGHNSDPQGLRRGQSVSLSSLNSISEEVIIEEAETDSIGGSDIESLCDMGKGKSSHGFAFSRRKKKERRSSDGSVEGNEGFHERMSQKMAHVSAKLGKIARVSRSVKVSSSKEEDKNDKKVQVMNQRK